ncbi:MAG: ABC transporter permease [Candidatus Vecturithrix sp.]|jgi:osmoprotectant transport system permease protein|nr:ABC transporter permease [Candidatus Vecturithrix sp.]
MMMIQYILENHQKILSLTMQHFYLFLISTIFAFLFGMLISIFVTREGNEKIGRIIITMTAMGQAVPSIAVVALAFFFLGIGAKPAIFALIIYSMVPIIFNAGSGLLSVPPEIIEASKGIGLTKQQILWKIELPLAVPVIMAGLRNAATINIGTATIASIIGGGGLGDLIFIGLRLNKNHLIFIGAGLAALLALIVDTLLYFCEIQITPKGLQVVQS